MDDMHFNDRLDKLRNYIMCYNRLPRRNSNNESKYIGLWLCHITQLYKNNKGIMAIPEYRTQWEAFKQEFNLLLL